MKKVTTFAMLGLLAGICLSANGPSEIAMSKCSKDNTAKGTMDDNSPSCGSKSDGDSDCNMSPKPDKPKKPDSGCNMSPKPDKPKKPDSGCNQDTSCDCESDVSEEADASLLMKTNRKSASKEI